MTRALLLAVLVCLVLLVRGRNGPEPSAMEAGPEPEPAAIRPDRSPTLPAAPSPAASPSLPGRPGGPDRTPVISRLARIEARRRLDVSDGLTYLDSLFTTPDSVVYRWADRTVLRVAILPAPDHPSLRQATQAALRSWTDGRIGLSFLEVTDSLLAEIVVGWIDQFDTSPGAAPGDSGRTGLTELLSDGNGEIRHARVTLARASGPSRPLDPAQVRAIAIHEIGHALGLPHSGHRGDVMYPAVLVTQLSERDRATAALLYLLPAGPLRERPPP